MQGIAKNIVRIIIKHLQMNQISALNYPSGVDMPLNNKLIQNQFNNQNWTVLSRQEVIVA